MITFDLNAISSRSKKEKPITVKQYLKNRKSVEKYVEIMKKTDPSNADFQKKFSNFFGINRAFGMNKGNYYNVFEKYAKKAPSTYTYEDILKDLADQTTGTGRIETSFGSKILHALNPDEPIIDKEVITKLRSAPATAPYFSHVPKKISSIDDAVALHNALKDCYHNCLIPKATSDGYFDAFDQEFPFAKHISEIKKIDFYLWAM